MNVFCVPTHEIDRRLTLFRDALDTASIDLAIIAQTSDLFYYSGTAQSAFLVVSKTGETMLFVRKYLPRAQRESPLHVIHPVRRFRDVLDALKPLPHTRIGIESDVLPVQLWQQIQASLPNTEIVDASHLIRRQRSLKSVWEQEQIAHAAGMLDEVFAAIPDWIQAGMQEIELAARIEAFLRVRGHQGFLPMRAFNGVIHYGNVLFGSGGAVRGPFDGPTNGAGLYPATPGGAGRGRLNPGEPIFIDLVAGYNGYLADATRVYALGALPDRLMDAHARSIDLQNMIVTGIERKDEASLVYQHVLEFVRQAGLEDRFMGIAGDQASFIAHGVGIEIDELPIITSRSEFPLPVGSVIAIEPKFVFDGIGAVGIESTWIVEERQAKRLMRYPDAVTVI